METAAILTWLGFIGMTLVYFFLRKDTKEFKAEVKSFRENRDTSWNTYMEELNLKLKEIQEKEDRLKQMQLAFQEDTKELMKDKFLLQEIIKEISACSSVEKHACAITLEYGAGQPPAILIKGRFPFLYKAISEEKGAYTRT